MSKSKTEPTFKVRELKDGSGFQVVMSFHERAADLLIADFSNEVQANEWVRKDSVSWLTRWKAAELAL